ncbi:TolC family protein [Nitrincola sp. MINF-07-Sa-05]|uniref:TolC family protein n=1 Tax=Nitrincola salilacus TaxID=3400273 RepID=UPI003918204E
MEPLSSDALLQVAQQDRQLIIEQIDPITAPVSLDEAIARALKHNLEHRTRMMEQALALGQFEAGRYDMLPRLMADAGYSSRNRYPLRDSVNQDGQVSESSRSISSDLSHSTFDLGLTWNLLDFGASYYSAKQSADRVLIANERRRKAMHLLIQNVRTAYWRAAAAQQLSDSVRQTIADAEAALADSRRISSEQLRSPLEAWRYQRTLLENLRLLEGVDRELSAARIELTGLMGLAPGAALRLALPDTVELPMPDMPVERMEELALMSNADLREQFYNARIAADETRKELLRLLPGITLSYTWKHDDDSYLVQNNWNEAGVRVSYNLLNLLAAPSKMRAADANEQVAETRRMALQMSLLTQVHLSRHQLNDAMRQYERAEEIFQVDNQLAQHASRMASSQVGSQLDSISANVTYILSSVRRYHALARVHESSSKLQAVMGLEPEIGSLDELNLDQLTQQVAVSIGEWAGTTPVESTP